MGAINGIFGMTGVAASAAGPLLFGQAYDHLGSYNEAFVASAAYAILCAAVSYSAPAV